MINYALAVEKKIDLHEIIHREGKWYYRDAGKTCNNQPRWMECIIDPEVDEVRISKKKGKFYIYHSPLFNLEYSFRW